MMKSSVCRWVFLFLAILTPAVLPNTVMAEDETHVVILGTSDMHGNVWGWSYEDNTETDDNGMSRLYTCISQVRDENPVTFLVDAGDDIQGSIMTDDIANATTSGFRETSTFPLIRSIRLTFMTCSAGSSMKSTSQNPKVSGSKM